MMQKIAVLGLGYIGLPTASMFATHGFQVLGVDIDQRVIDTLNKGGIHIDEPGLSTVVRAALHSGNLTISTALQPCDVFIIAVPTPITRDKKADLSFVKQAAEAVAGVLKTGDLVVLEATSPPRTTIDLVQPILEKSGLQGGKDFLLAYSPERVLPGRILDEMVHNSRVIGGITPASAAAGKALYQAFVDGEIRVTDATTAEMIKLMENTYRDVNIALANEFSRLADQFGVDVWQAIEIANLHPRVEILRPGPGVGGHCISVDPWFFVEKAPDIAHLIRQARQVNDAQPGYVVELLQNHFGDLQGIQLAALGVTYKADVDDLRESPALGVIQQLLERGAEVKAYDPHIKPESSALSYLVSDLSEACRGSMGLLMLVNHKQFQTLDPKELAGLMKTPYILDTRNIIEVEIWKEAGFNVKILGDGLD